MIATVVEDPETGAIFFARRREGGLFGGLWEPPMVEAGSVGEARDVLGKVGVSLGKMKLLETGRITHVLTHRRLLVTVVSARRVKGFKAQEELGEPYEKAAWLDPDKPGVGVSTLARKVIAATRAVE